MRWLQTGLDEDFPPHVESRIRCRGGDERVCFWSTVRLQDPEGRVTGLLSIGADITDQRSAETRNVADNMLFHNKLALFHDPGCVPGKLLSIGTGTEAHVDREARRPCTSRQTRGVRLVDPRAGGRGERPATRDGATGSRRQRPVLLDGRRGRRAGLVHEFPRLPRYERGGRGAGQAPGAS